MEKETAGPESDLQELMGLVTIAMLVISAGGLGGLLTFMEPAKEWALNTGILVQGTAVLFALPGDPTIGLDAGRALLAAGGILVLILGSAYLVIRRHQRRKMVV